MDWIDIGVMIGLTVQDTIFQFLTKVLKKSTKTILFFANTVFDEKMNK